MQSIKHLLLFLFFFTPQSQTHALDETEIEIQTAQIEVFLEDYKEGNYERAFNNISIACENNNAMACWEIGRMYIYGDQGEVVKPDIQKSIALINKSCTLGYDWACFQLIDIHTSGYDDIPINHEKALTAMIAACNGGVWDLCALVADMYMEGKDIQQDKVKAKEYYTRVCSLGDTESCDKAKQIK